MHLLTDVLYMRPHRLDADAKLVANFLVDIAGSEQVEDLPLRVARGIQNKILEAMAMARPVVVSSAAAAGLSGVPGKDFEVAETPEDFARKVVGTLDPGVAAAMGRHARDRVVSDYSWDRNLAVFDRLLDDYPPAVSRKAR